MTRWPTLLLLCTFFLATSNLQAVEKRDYYATLTVKEEENIRYIINTLSGRSSMSLLFYKGELERRGDQTGDVHPLNYLGFVFTDPDLKRKANNINRTVWRRFVAGFEDSFQDAVKNKNLQTDQIQHFAKRTGLPQEKVEKMVAKRNWEKLMNALRTNAWEEIRKGQ